MVAADDKVDRFIGVPLKVAGVDARNIAKVTVGIACVAVGSQTVTEAFASLHRVSVQGKYLCSTALTPAVESQIWAVYTYAISCAVSPIVGRIGDMGWVAEFEDCNHWQFEKQLVVLFKGGAIWRRKSRGANHSWSPQGWHCQSHFPRKMRKWTPEHPKILNGVSTASIVPVIQFSYRFLACEYPITAILPSGQLE